MDDKPIFKSRGPGIPGAFTGEEVVSEETIKELARRINGGRTMERKQTAVEWLIDQFEKHENGQIDWMSRSATKSQALQMEKEQELLARKESYDEGWLEATQYIMKRIK